MSTLKNTMSLREQKKRQTRLRILKVAESMFAEKGFDQVMVNELAERAEVSQKTFFNYFPSKAATLKALLIDYLEESNLWAHTTELEASVESAIVPPNVEEIQDWVVQRRQLLQLIFRHTDLFNSIYLMEGDGEEGERLFPAKYKQPRVERIRKAQQMKVVRDDISAEMIADMYDYVRIDMVRRWLCLSDDIATPERYKREYQQGIDILLKGLSA
ncbi:TetR/AcrR family transcriptional regulator [Paraferrimonas sedimenticola]|uniref:HTH tetR-type domain-containing protein n=1 Tax=Paraferrimonas sedimenticola TaxID=375674 RepID=A0AA37RXX5_9GAMM|nr:TetR/AcrR family transcriptional regulator [Paraferrimonas sedimenticola]GLP96637.1 hypothetical protein GCM10007895_19430 [Paraferrimonas sedimenticola]